MAYSDLIDLKNIETCLVAGIEFRSASTGAYVFTVYVGDRYGEFNIPSGSAVQVSGIVREWREFGYLADLRTDEQQTSDASFVLSYEPVNLWDESFNWLMHYWELIGGRVTIYRFINSPSGWEGRKVFTGVLRDPPQATNAGIEIRVVDLSPIMGNTPNELVALGTFPNAPESSIGRYIPIVLGDFLEDTDDPFGLEYLLQRLGMGTFSGIPCVCIDDGRDSSSSMGIFRASSHDLKETSGDAAVALQHSSVDDRAHLFDNPDAPWTITNGSGCAEVEISRPADAFVVAMPGGVAEGNEATDPENAWDRDSTTYVTMSVSGTDTLALEGTIPSLTSLGYLHQLWVYCWYKNGEPRGSLRVGLWNPETTNWAGGVYEDEVPNGEGLVVVQYDASDGNWFSWDPNERTVRANLMGGVFPSAGGYCEIVALAAVFRFWPGAEGRVKRQYVGQAIASDKILWSTDTGLVKKRFSWRGGATQIEGEKVMLYCSGLEDDASGTYTGTPNSLIENGADHMHYLLGELSALSSSDIASSSSDFGNFGDARTALGAYHKLAVHIPESSPTNDWLHRLAMQCRATPIWNAEGKRGVIVRQPAPSVDYRSAGSPFLFSADEHIVSGSFKFWKTPIEEVVNRVFVEFDYDYGKDQFRKTTFITEDDSDNGLGTRDQTSYREGDALLSQTRYQSVNELRIQAYDIRHQGVAKAIRNFFFDWRWRSKLCIQFDTYLNASDLSIGNVIGLADATIAGREPPAPDATSSGWDDFTWYVLSCRNVAGRYDTPRYRVTAIEAVDELYSGTWTAAADD